MPTATELRELDDDELEGRLTEYRREILNLRFQLGTGQLDNVTRLAQVRRDVARVLTVLRDREIAVAEGRDAGPVVAVRPRRPRPEEAAETSEPEERAPRPPRARRSTARSASGAAGTEPSGTEEVERTDEPVAEAEDHTTAVGNQKDADTRVSDEEDT
jgi:large subunit ribosomal protein L29